MLALSSTLINQPILSLRTGGLIGNTVEPIINPHNLQIIGWWCEDLFNNRESILQTSEVRDTIPRGIVIDDHSAFSDLDDLARLKSIIEIDFKLINKTVRTKRKKLGKVSDYCYDEGYFVQKLYVEQSLIKVTADTLIIGRNQIVEVNDNEIVVDDAEIKSNSTATERLNRIIQSAPNAAAPQPSKAD